MVIQAYNTGIPETAAGRTRPCPKQEKKEEIDVKEIKHTSTFPQISSHNYYKCFERVRILSRAASVIARHEILRPHSSCFHVHRS